MNTNNTILSILIVTYNSENEIENCIKSIPKTIRNKKVQIIISDNNSTDKTCEIIDKYKVIRLIRNNSNLGFGAANNLCYRFAIGEYILYLNPDTIVNISAISSCIDQLIEHKDYGIISPRLLMENGELDLACRRSIPNVWDGFCRAIGLSSRYKNIKLFSGYNLTYMPIGDNYEVGCVNGAFMLTKRSYLEEVGQFDENFFMYGEDMDLCYRFRLKGYKIIYYGKEYIIHLKGMSSSKISDKMTKALFLSTKMFYEKHFNPNNNIIISYKYKIMFKLWEVLNKFRKKISKSKSVRPA